MTRKGKDIMRSVYLYVIVFCFSRELVNNRAAYFFNRGQYGAAVEVSARFLVE